jgi:NitT/TauT family transport system ATP-binding protein
MSLIAATGLAVALDGRTILTGIDLSIGRGEIVGLLGPSGCGKTTLVRALAGLLPPAAGRLTVTAERLAPVFQEPRLLPWADIRDNAAFGLAALGHPQAEARRRAEQALRAVDLPADVDRRWPHALSGGMRQRVGLARALAIDPDLLLLDEPFNAVDVALRRRLETRLARHTAAGAGALLVTHDLAEAARTCTRLLRLGGTPTTVVGTGLPEALAEA